MAGIENRDRKGLESFWKDNVAAADIVALLNKNGLRTHVRKADHYYGNILDPPGTDACVRVSVCHYNTRQEVKKLLTVLNE